VSRSRWTPIACAALLFLCGAAAAAGDARLGQDKADSERCLECHSPQPHDTPTSGPDARFAKLTGQAPDYMLKQIRDFRSGARKHDFMAMMARSIDDADAADIVAFFASLPPMKGDGSGDNEPGRRLYTNGDAARGIAACIGCHGPAGKGRTIGGTPLPVIGGQQWRYLDQQLRAWRSGERRNSPDGAMNAVTRALTDPEIEALASYLAGQ